MCPKTKLHSQNSRYTRKQSVKGKYKYGQTHTIYVRLIHLLVYENDLRLIVITYCFHQH